MQALAFGIKRVDAVIYTHIHADHVNGIDDLRSFNFVQKESIPIYATNTSAQRLQQIFGYAFTRDDAYEGGAPPRLTLHTFEPFEPLHLFGVHFIPLVVMHGKMEVMAFRVAKFAYATDCNMIPDRSKELLRGLDCLILDGLRLRPHPTHFTHEQAVKEIEDLKPKQSYLTHISHEVDHTQTNQRLQELTRLAVKLAYDGLQILL